VIDVEHIRGFLQASGQDLVGSGVVRAV
jgi:hypothetical protein